MKLLFLDIETSPIDAWAWGTWGENIPPARIKKPQRVLCWAAANEGDKDITFMSEWDHGHREMVEGMWELVDEADAVCHYNGIKFDMKHLNREFLLAGLPPPSPYKNIDLYQTVRKNFSFPSYKLDYVARELGLGAKLDTSFELWPDVIAGNKKAQRMMEDYNVMDVELTEALYYVLQGWIKPHPNRGLWVADTANPVCPNCGSSHVVKRGIERPARVNAYQRYKCNDCGANSRGRIIVQQPGDGLLI